MMLFFTFCMLANLLSGRNESRPQTQKTVTGNDIYIEFNYSVLFLCIYFYSYFLFLASIILFGSWVLYKRINIHFFKQKKIHIEKKDK